MAITLVIFDMDGLMFDTEKLSGECFINAAKEYHYSISQDARLKMLGHSLNDNRRLLKEIYGMDFPFDLISKRGREMREEIISRNGIEMKEGLQELLRYLKKKKIVCAIASSSKRSDIELNISLYKLEEYFAYIISGEDVVNSKPNPEIFLRVIKELGVTPQETLVLEDSENGIEASYNAQIPVICIPDLVQPSQIYENKCLHILKSLLEVMRIV